MYHKLLGIVGKVVDGTADVLVNVNDTVEDVVDEIPVVGEMFVEKLWSPVVNTAGRIAYMPFKVLGLGKRY